MFEGSGRLHPEATFPALAAAIAEVSLRPDRSLGGGSAILLEQTRALLSLRRQLDARLLSRLAAIDSQGLAAADGFASTGAWVRAAANLDPGPAAGLVAAARLSDQLPALADVLATGKVGVEHVQAVARGASRVPYEVLAVSDSTLATLAPHVRPSDMRRAAAAIQAHHDETSMRGDAAYLHEARRVSLSRTLGDAYCLDGLLEPEAGAALEAALEPLMAKRGAEDERTVCQRRADALVELVGIALRSAELPDCGGDRPRITFLVRTAAGADRLGLPDLHDLAGAATGVGSGAAFGGGQIAVSAHSGDPVGSGLLLGTRTMFPWEAVARLCCDADLNVASVNQQGEILNYGRTRRYPTPAQRRALALRDHGCVFPGCDRPPSMSQAHHLVWWSLCGPTDLANLALVCHFHHHLIHEGNWRLERIPPGLPTAAYPQGAPGWQATGPDGRQHRYHRQPAA